MEAIRRHQVVILAGETGSGKTTQLPQMCLRVAKDGAGWRGKIGCTQPRRVAAMSVSKRVAEELGVVWGREVGCKMRFNDDTSRETRIKFMTDGILLAEIQGDPWLREYSMLIIDEAHERSLNIDFLLGYLKGLLRKRADLKLIVTSATIDTEAFSKHFDDAPIIEVSGRLYPVEIRYQPTASFEDQTHVEAAVAAVEDALIESSDGDVLVFMPTERDIRETRDLLDGRLGAHYEVLALYGRMTAAEQQRIFAPGRKRRVVVSTNVAETSVTIPRIRYVVDTGLARMSRYNPRTRTKRLPVEEVSQSSANQRSGRAGRVQDGVCVRLFDQEDFDKREKFTQPEIQRANLAEVILRMKAFKLGEIENFPFINPPSQASIRGGYELLHELGALDDAHQLSSHGRELARLPVDPTLGRMLLQARKEGALPEVLVIAAGLSVPDPRERPEDAKELAAAAHKAFWCPDSDFLSLLRIWQAAPDPRGQSGSLNQLRKFCKKNYLSLTRMREWRDIWRQLGEALKLSRGEVEEERKQADDVAIHRAILAGNLGHIAMRVERNTYKAAGNRQAMVFPGSNLYLRREKKVKDGALAEKLKQPLWIVAGEIVQTSQLFARTIAKIEPQWISELAEHLLQHKYSEPHFHVKSARVLVWQRSLLHGLEISRQQIDFGKVDGRGATQVFIRHALVQNEVFVNHDFHAHNQKLREKIETSLTRVRNNRVYAVEEAMFDFYDERLKGHTVSSLHDLNRVMAVETKKDVNFLKASEHDLTHGHGIDLNLELFPDQVPIGNTVLPLSYAYNPGQEDDGVTLKISVDEAHQLSQAQLQWMVPGLREELVSVLLRALPKAARRVLMPIDAKVAEVVREYRPGAGDFLEGFAAFLSQRYGLSVSEADWPSYSIPQHLQPRVQVMDRKQKELVVDRDLRVVRTKLKAEAIPSGAWERAARLFERPALSSWSFGDVEERMVLEKVGEVELVGYPALVLEKDGSVSLRLLRDLAAANAATPLAIRKLGENVLGRDLAWLSKELRGFSLAGQAVAKRPVSLQDALSGWQAPGKTAVVSASDLPQQAFDHILDHALRLEPLHPLKEARFRAMCETARKQLPALAHRTRELFREIHAMKASILKGAQRYAGMEEDLERLVPVEMLKVTPHRQLQHVSRYLKAVKVRAERAAIHPAKDADKAELIADYEGWEGEVAERHREAFRWMLEEYRVQVFAQELGTAQPVSPKRLEALMSGAG